jgi:hypothetical protein
MFSLPQIYSTSTSRSSLAPLEEGFTDVCRRGARSLCNINYQVPPWRNHSREVQFRKYKSATQLFLSNYTFPRFVLWNTTIHNTCLRQSKSPTGFTMLCSFCPKTNLLTRNVSRIISLIHLQSSSCFAKSWKRFIDGSENYVLFEIWGYKGDL